MKCWIIGAVAVVALAGCGSDATVPSGDGTPASTQSAPIDQAVTVEVTIKDGKVAPKGKRVEVAVDQPIQLRVTSDVPEELHVHSEPEHEFEVKAAADQTFTFRVDVPGQVAVELHQLNVTVVQLVVRL